MPVTCQDTSTRGERERITNRLRRIFRQTITWLKLPIAVS
jgi:hypothetical protein